MYLQKYISQDFNRLSYTTVTLAP